MHAYVETQGCTPIRIPAYTHVYMCAYVRAHVCKCISTCVHTDIYTCMCTYIYIPPHFCIPARLCMRTWSIHTHTHTSHTRGRVCRPAGRHPARGPERSRQRGRARPANPLPAGAGATVVPRGGAPGCCPLPTWPRSHRRPPARASRERERPRHERTLWFGAGGEERGRGKVARRGREGSQEGEQGRAPRLRGTPGQLAQPRESSGAAPRRSPRLLPRWWRRARARADTAAPAGPSPRTAARPRPARPARPEAAPGSRPQRSGPRRGRGWGAGGDWAGEASIARGWAGAGGGGGHGLPRDLG